MKKNLIKLISFLTLAILATGCNNQSGGSSKANDGSEYVTGVTLSFEEYNFSGSGESVTLEATVNVKEGKEYSGNITWRSSAPSVASVEGGLVTALKGGECYITAQAGYKVGKCKITIPKGIEPVGNLTLSDPSISIKPNTNMQLHAYLNGTEVTEGVTWTTSLESVATVDSNGLVSGVAVGEANIRAEYSGKTASCSVIVSEDAVVPFTIALDKTSLTIIENATAALRAITSEPAEVTWSSSNEAVATVVSGVVTGVKKGNAVITASANGKSATCNVTVSEPHPIDPGDEEDDKVVLVRFYLDYNNITEEGKLAEFMWYQNVPLKGSADVPANPTVPADPAFPYFVGWSTHTLIDSKDDLWNMDTDFVDGTEYTLTLYGIWLDVEVMTA